jgi:hypothetical protein
MDHATFLAAAAGPLLNVVVQKLGRVNAISDSL